MHLSLQCPLKQAIPKVEESSAARGRAECDPYRRSPSLRRHSYCVSPGCHQPGEPSQSRSHVSAPVPPKAPISAAEPSGSLPLPASIRLELVQVEIRRPASALIVQNPGGC